MQAQVVSISGKHPTSCLGWRRLVANTRRLAFAIAAVAGATIAHVPSAGAQASEPTVEGVWRVTRHGVVCQTGQVLGSFPALMAFGRDGIVTGYAVGPGSTPAMGSPDYGVWKRGQGPGFYSFRLVAMNYEASGAFSGTIEVTGELVMRDPNTFTYQSNVQHFDAFGNPLFAHCGAAEGSRFR